MSKRKDDLAETQIHGEILILWPKVKVIQRSSVYKTYDVSSYGDTLMCQIWNDYVKGQKSCDPNMKTVQKPYKFDLKVKGQHRIDIMNVRDTASYGD